MLIVRPGSARAQQQQARQSTAVQLLRPAVKTMLADTLRPARTHAVKLPSAAYGRLDVRANVLRAAYRISARVRTAKPQRMAQAYLRQQAHAFGWGRQLAHLRLDTVKTGTAGQSHRVYRQTLAGLPVWGGRVVLSQRSDGQPAMLVSGFHPNLGTRGALDPTPRLSSAEARAAARRLVRRGSVRTSSPRLIVYPSDAPRLAWRLLAWPSAAPAEWEVLVDAHTGDVIRVEDQSIRLGKPKRAKHENALSSGRASSRLHTGAAEGQGFAFDPDPLSTAGTTYDQMEGGSFNNNQDSSTTALREQRQEVKLRGITQGDDGRYRLDGPYVRIVGKNVSGDVTYAPPTADTPAGFHFRRSEDGFEAVNAYYHVDKSRRDAERLGYTGGGRGALRVNPQAIAADESRYFPGRHFLEMGTGGVDDAEDASVVRHEHAHALLDEAAPGLRASREGKALHEGWADYWAAAYARHLVETEKIKRDDWRRIFKWDSGDGEIWPGRVVRHKGRYPEATRCDDSPNCNIYQDGLLWATTLMEIYDALGYYVTNRLALASFAYLSDPVTFRDAAEALIQADRALYDGGHLSVLLERLSKRGLAEPDAYGPVLTFEPLPPTEQTTGTVDVSVKASSVSAPVDTVRFVYGYDAKPKRQLLLHEQDSTYVGALPLPDTPDTVRYFVEAIDAEGRFTRAPAEPGSTYTFIAGTDRVPPSIRHTAPDDVALAAWPVTISARVRDRFAIDSVGAHFEIENAQGTVERTGHFSLKADTNDYYRGAFPVAASEVAPGSQVRYRIYARDASQAKNATLQPEGRWFSFLIKKKGRLYAYDFESPVPGLRVEGTRFQDCPSCMWTRGRPTYGVHVAHSGKKVIAVAPDTSYSDAPGRTALDLPTLNLRDAPPTYLVFWHWYDFEHGGAATPHSSDTTRLWDGGNIKISTDAGETWRVAQPEHGYNGTIAEGAENPLGGQRGFGGYSYAWRRVVVPLPAKRSVRVRLEAGFDATNEHASLAYAGWYLDDLVLTTEHPLDVRAPEVAEKPASPLTRTVQRPSATITVKTQDDTGVEDVFAAYRLENGSATTPDTIRLAMSTEDRNLFRGRLAPRHNPEVGNNLKYRLLLRDAGGQETTYPAEGEPPLVVRYRQVQTTRALVHPTATGAWHSTQGGWTASLNRPLPSSSHLTMQPVYVPDSTESLRFTLLHAYHFEEGVVGNVKIRPEDRESWQVLTPEEGYKGQSEPERRHSMKGEPSFPATSGGVVTSTFDLSPYTGQRIQLRLDAVATASTTASRWTIREAKFRFATVHKEFGKPSRLALDANYPEPFRQATTIDYAVPDRRGGGAAVQVHLDVYDVLGRRVAVLVDKRMQPGAYTEHFDAGSLPAGVYFARLRVGAKQRVERLVVAR